MKKNSHYILGIVELIGFLVAYTLIQALFIMNQTKVTVGFIFDIAIRLVITGFVLYLMYWFYHHQLELNNPRKLDMKPHFKWRNLIIAILGIAAIMALQYIFSNYITSKAPENQQEIDQILQHSNFMMPIMITVVAPIAEELIFRGVLLNVFFKENTVINNVLGVIFSGLLFGLMHEPKFSVFLIVYAGMGMILATIYLVTKDIRYSILAHMGNNIISLLPIFLI